MSTLRIATRKSPLALWQAEHVRTLISAEVPALETQLVEMTTAGDRFLDIPLSAVGGKGLFVKEIEQALLEGRADLAVHSLKDVTSAFPEGLCLAGVPVREDPRDAWVSVRGVRFEDLPPRARIGTSSLRRACQIRERRPDVGIVPLRGNVQTRLRKTEELGLDGTVLAAAGLLRLGLAGRITEILAPEVSLPAVGQGALALECRTGDGAVRAVAARLEDPETRVAVRAERGFLTHLEGGCTVPLAGYAVLEAGRIWLRGLIGSPDGVRVIRGERRGGPSEAEALGRDLAEELLGRGGRDVLAHFAGRAP